MPDHWSFVVAAYGIAAVVLGGYWRFLTRRARELDRLAASSRAGRGGTGSARRAVRDGAPAAGAPAR